MGKTLNVLILAAFLAAGCAVNLDPGGDDSPTPPVNQPRTTLKKLSDCGEATKYLVDATKWEVTHPVSSFGGVPTAGGAGGGAGAAFPPADSAETKPPSYTGTNVQTPGVDEPDLVKTDGGHLYTLAGGNLVILKAWPPGEMAELSRLAVAGSPVSLLLHGDLALVFTQEWVQASGPLADGAFVCKSTSLTRATLIDLTNRAAPVVVREIAAEGDFLDGRMIDGVAHFVVTNRPTWLYPVAVGGPVPATAQEILPAFRDEGGGGTGEVTIGSCSDTYVPEVPASSGMVTLFTLDLKLPDPPLSTVRILGVGERIYASPDSLVVASANDSQWLWAAPQGGIDTTPSASTLLHRFALTNPPSYSSSAKVEGWLTSGFSLDEHGGYLRVATTTPNWLGGVVVNQVHLLKIAPDSLTEAATLKGLGKPGESIFAVRFLNNRGYVVTFLQTDPLYVLDLADPLQPKIAGELEVEGVSTYLHPLGDGHLIAVGRAADGGGALSLFNVADPAAPTLAATVALGQGSYSEAQYDHHAFTYFADRDLLAIPVTRWTGTPWADATSTGSVFTGLSVYKVDTATGFTLEGEVDHASFYKETSTEKWFYPEPVRRSLFIGDEANGDVLYSVSARGIKATDADDLTQDIKAVDLPAYPVYWTGPQVSDGGGGGAPAE